MGALDQIVDINITQLTRAVPQEGFGIPLIVGPNAPFSERIKYYADAADMLDDGFDVADPEYIYAQKAFSQSLRPDLVGIGRRTHLSSAGIATDLVDIQNESDSWYGVTITDNDDATILAAAAQIETMKKILVVASSSSHIPTASSDDVMTTLKGLDYKRTALIYTEDKTDGKEAAWLGGQLPQVPGSSTWKFKQLTGTTPDDFTSSQRVILIGTPGSNGKNANIYEIVGGVPITEEGWMAGGQFIDITVGLDWLESRMQTNIYAVLVNAPKIPYTDRGAAIIENEVRKTLLEGAANGLIDGSSIEVTAEPVLDQNSNDRANRIYPGINFTCRLAGAFHYVVINGIVTV